jgi:hypothetical protein
MHAPRQALRAACLIFTLAAVARADGTTSGPDCTAAPSVTTSGCGYSACTSCDNVGGSLCDGGCCGSAFENNCFESKTRLLGMLPSDHAFDSFVSPLSNPFFFEDPRSLTEVRSVFISNRVPNSIGPGQVEVWAAQVRGRITERLSLIAPRLGNMDIQIPGNSSGFMSAPIGFKYNLVRDVQSQFLLSAGMTYFIEGSNRVYQGFDDGDFHLFLTGGKQIGNGHWISGSGFRLPSNNQFGNQMWYWSNQWDYRLPGNIYPLIGLNWFHFMRSPAFANGGGTNFSGLDLVNLPFGNVAGTNVVTCAIGLKWKPTGNFEFGGGWEFPVTNRTDVLQNRAYFDAILRF